MKYWITQLVYLYFVCTELERLTGHMPYPAPASNSMLAARDSEARAGWVLSSLIQIVHIFPIISCLKFPSLKVIRPPRNAVENEGTNSTNTFQRKQTR